MKKFRLTSTYTISVDILVEAEDEDDAIHKATDDVIVDEYINNTVGADTNNMDIEIESVNADGMFDDWNVVEEVDED